MRRRPSDTTLLVGLAVALLAWASAPFLFHGFTVPLGPDAPVYLWWARIAGVEGLSAVGERTGEPALALALAGTLRTSTVATLTALEIGGTVAIGLAAAALVRSVEPDERASWTLAGLLAGTFASHLAAGYVANLLFAAMFIAAAIALAGATRRGAIAAALLLGAAGITHPLFLGLGVAILALAAMMAFREPGVLRRELGAAVGGAAILGVSALAMHLGPDALRAETSRDAFLRRAGLDAILRDAYLERFLRRWPRYAPWGVLPLAVAGLARVHGTVRRFLVAWGVAIAVGVATAIATRAFPPDRFLTFAFVLPILAGPGAVRIARTSSLPRAAARLLAGGLVGAMLVGAGWAWFGQTPFLTSWELASLARANAVAVAAPDAALVVPVSSGSSAFVATRVGNLARAALPPERIRDLVIEVVGTADGVEAAALSATARADVAAATAARGGRVQRILIVPFAPNVTARAPWIPIAPGVYADPPVVAGSASDPLLPSSPVAMTLAGVAASIFLFVVGAAGARAIGLDVAASFALAPAIGMASLVLTATALDRVGLRLTGVAVPLVASALAVALGLAGRYVAERRVGG